MQTRTTSLPQPAPRETDPTALAAEIVEHDGMQGAELVLAPPVLPGVVGAEDG